MTMHFEFYHQYLKQQLLELVNRQRAKMIGRPDKVKLIHVLCN